MKSQKQLQEIGEKLLNNKKFMSQLETYIKKIQSDIYDTQNSTIKSQYQFAFQKASKKGYPWTTCQNNQPIQSLTLIQDMSNCITDTIQNSLHQILNKEFINVTNQILAMREEISIFTKQQMKKAEDMKLQFNKQLQIIRKKISQQNVNNQPSNLIGVNKFFRSGISNGVGINSMNSTVSSETPQKKSIHHQLYELKKQIQHLKKREDINTETKHLQQSISHLQDKFSEMNLQTKIKIQEIKQKSKKNYQLLSAQVKATSSQELIKNQIKKSLKSALKIYLDQIMKCKKQISELNQVIQKNDKGIQQYVCNQLKSVWTVFTGMKRRMENLEQAMDLGNQSMMIE